VSEDLPRAARRIDDSEEDPKRGRLARTVRAKQAVDRSRWHREAHPVDRARVAEFLDEIDRFDGEAILSLFVLSLSKH
jgi:hypothetical protein